MLETDKLNVLRLLIDAINKNSVKSGEQKGQNAPFSLDGLIKAFKNFSQNKSQAESSLNAQNVADSEKAKQTPPTLPPLQSGLLGVMTSHDEFIKRVKEKNKTP